MPPGKLTTAPATVGSTAGATGSGLLQPDTRPASAPAKAACSSAERSCFIGSSGMTQAVLAIMGV